MKQKLKWTFVVLVVGFGLMQLIIPSRTNPPVVKDFLASSAPVPPHIAALLRAACYDCHSHETRWPWYSRVAPVSWLVAHDVNEGRQHLDLSDWPAGMPDAAGRRLDNMSEEIDYRDMPPKKYTLIHVNARLTDKDRKELTDWLDAKSDRVRAPGK